jgi:uncharacterized membrane protein YbaN (DUF454 family)
MVEHAHQIPGTVSLDGPSTNHGRSAPLVLRHAVGISKRYRPIVTVVKNRPVRLVLMALGWLWVGIAFIGTVVPGIPFTGPIILAAFLFSKSSERFDEWLLNNKLFGSIVRDWRAGNGFTVRAKVAAVIAIIISFGISTLFFLTAGYVRAIMWTIAAGVAIFIVSRPTKRTSGFAESAVS